MRGVSGTALLALILAGCGSDHKADEVKAAQAVSPAAKADEIVIPADSPQLSQIKVAAVEEADVPFEVVTAPGKIEANPNRMSRIVLPLPGRVDSVFVKLGDSVKRGDPLLTLESPDADVAASAYLGALAGLNTAKTAQLKAQSDYDRSKDLFDHKAVAEKEKLAAEAALSQARAGVEQAEASREQTQRRLELLGLKPGKFGQKITVSAPISGKVLEMSVAAGEYRNDTTAPLMVIADLSSVWVSSDVPETQIRFIDIGERLDIQLSAFPGQTFRGRVTRIADTVDPQTRTIKVRAEMNNLKGLLRPEMFGNIRHVESTRRPPLVPVAAVIQAEGQSTVYREKSRGVFDPVRVELAAPFDGKAGVLKGLKAGDRIVVDGVMLLKNS
jgi:cobalt-zinc-cadmium efflux system membrane fusion protein